MGDWPAYILAGGESTRFGSDKARLRIAGEPLILKIARGLASHCSSITVVSTGNRSYEDLGLPTIYDLRPGLGPMGGLETTIEHRLAHSGEGWLLLCACDLLELRQGWISALMAQAESNPEAGAVAFRGDRWEPLIALYRTSALREVKTCLSAGRYAMQTLLDKMEAVPVPYPSDWPLTSQVNRHRDLRRWLVERTVGQGIHAWK